MLLFFKYKKEFDLSIDKDSAMNRLGNEVVQVHKSYFETLGEKTYLFKGNLNFSDDTFKIERNVGGLRGIGLYCKGKIIYKDENKSSLIMSVNMGVVNWMFFFLMTVLFLLLNYKEILSPSVLIFSLAIPYFFHFLYYLYEVSIFYTGIKNCFNKVITDERK